MRAPLSFLLMLLASCMAPEVGGPADPPEVGPLEGLQNFRLGRSSAAQERGDRAEAGVTPAAATLAPDAPAARRHVIYSAVLRMVVVSLREAQASIVALATEAGGHLQESDSRSVTVRVPAAAFDGVLGRIQALGEVVDSSVRAADVTEELLALEIRLENARKARERLLEHLERSEKMEDTLKIEAELTRVTGEIERMEGRLRYLASQIAMSTIRVELNTNQPQQASDGLDLPFEWIARLGDGLVAGSVQARPRQPRILARGPRFDPPPNFVRYYSSKELVEALDAEGVRIKVQAHENHDEGGLGFWDGLARKALVERRALAVREERALAEDRTLLVGTREVGGQSQGYLLVLVRSKRTLHTFEAWGPAAAIERIRPDLIESASSLRP